MNICYVITRSDSIGGAQVHVLELASALLEEGHDVTVLVGQKGPFTRELERRGVPFRSLRYLVRPIEPFLDTRALYELTQELRRLRPELVGTHSSKAGWIGRIAAKLLGIPSTFTVHGWAFTEGVPRRRRHLYKVAEQLVAPIGDRIITVSEYDRQLAIKEKVAPADKIVTIHNGVRDVPDRLRAHPEQTPVQLVMVARFDAPKDHHLLLQALRMLREYPWNLALIGDGPLRREVEQAVQLLGLAGRVRFHGTVNNIAERLALAQLFVLTSKWEGLPLSILEAMRAGLPVVASDVGGVREAVIDGETGFLVPRENLECLVNRLTVLLQRPDLRVQMGRAGRQYYERQFALDRMVGATMAVYTEVLKRNRLSN